MKPTIRMQSVMDIVCETYNVTQEAMFSLSKKRNIARPRQVYCYLAYLLTTETLTDIGASIRRDHSTVVHSSNKISNELRFYKNLAEEIFEMKLKLKPTIPIIITDVDLLGLTEKNTNSFLIAG